MERAFEDLGRNPLAWWHSARNLIDGAEAVKEKVQDVGELMHSLTAVQAMLLGLAIECLLKGMWIKAGNTLTKDGRYARVPEAGDHELKQLAHAAGVSASEKEKGALERLSKFVKYAGRYPIPTAWEDMKLKQVNGVGTVAPTFLTKAEVETAERIADRLMQEVLPWNGMSRFKIRRRRGL